MRLRLLIGLAVLAATAAACGQAAQRQPRRVRAVSAPTPRAAAPKAVRITIAASGDLLIHQPVWDRALADGHGHYDFRPMLRAIRPIVRRADIALCHVETPLLAGAPTGYPVFRTPPALARAIHWAGYDACSTASNHSLDDGQAGIDSTVRALSRAHVRHAGSANGPRNATRTTMLQAKGVRVAFLAYTALTNGFTPPHAWSLNLADPARIIRDARRARRRGAQVVIVNLHWGVEYQNAPSADQWRLARLLARSHEITAVVGQHVHVIQPIRWIGTMPVVFGEGNLLSNQTAACCPAGSQDGIIALLTVRVAGGRARVVRVRHVATWVRHPDFTVLPVARALAGHWADAGELRASLARTRQALHG